MKPDVYSHGHHASVVRSHARRTVHDSAAYLLDHLHPSDRVLDIGCGPGSITVGLADLVPDGTVVGVEVPLHMVEAARAEHQRPNLTFELGDVYGLEYPDESFDVVHAHQVLQHLSDPLAALREMRRVLRPGGLLAVRDSDYGAFRWSPDDQLLDRWLANYRGITQRNRAEADAGRFLHRWVREAGFTDRVVTTSTWTYQSEADRQFWGSTWAERAVSSEYARQAVDYGLSDADELARIADAFRRWAADDDGWWVLLHGEVIARRP